MRVLRRKLAPRDFHVEVVGSELASWSFMVRCRQTVKPRQIFARTAKPVLQRLKPLRGCLVYVAAKATTYKDS
jgi:hypothetical protein